MHTANKSVRAIDVDETIYLKVHRYVAAMTQYGLARAPLSFYTMGTAFAESGKLLLSLAVLHSWRKPTSTNYCHAGMHVDRPLQ